MNNLLKPDDVRAIFPNRDHVDDQALIKKAHELLELVKTNQTSHRLIWYPDHVTTMDLIGQYTLQLDVYYKGNVEFSINTDVEAKQIGEERAVELLFKERLLPLTGYHAKCEYWEPTPGLGEVILFTYQPA